MSDDIRIIKGYRVKRHPDGRLETLGPATEGPQPVTIGTPNPVRVQQGQEDLRGAQLDNQGQAITNQGGAIDNTVSQGTARTTIQTNQAPAGFMWVDPNDPRKGVMPIPGYDPKGGSVDRNKLAQFRALEAQLARVEELYKEGPGATSGLWGVSDYFPTADNSKFNTAAAGLAEIGKAAFRVEGSGDQNGQEVQMFVDANTPSASDKDEAILEKIRNLRTRLTETYQELGITPSGEEARTRNPWQLPFYGQQQTQVAGVGDKEYIPPNPALKQDVDALTFGFIRSQNPDVDAYIASLKEIYAKHGAQMAPEAEIRSSLESSVLPMMQQGQAFEHQGMVGTEKDMGLGQTAFNYMLGDTGGAAAAGYLNSAGLGVPEMLTGTKMDAIRQDNPLATTVGEVGGAVTGTAGIGMLGRQGMKLAGRELGESTMAQFWRNLAADATYGAGYGASTEGDPLTGAALASVGSAGGQTIGKGLKATIGGVDLTKAAQTLRDSGVSLSPGRILGDTASRVEDKMVSWPLVGDMIRKRQQEGFRQFNEAAFREAGAPIGATPSAVGEEGLAQLRGSVSDAYDSATAGARAPFDQPFMDDMQSIYNASQRMPYDRQNALGEIIDARMAHLVESGSMTGKDYQQAMRALKGNRSSVPGKFEGFEEEYRSAITGTMDALDGTMRRGGGEDVIAGLNAANAANKNMKILENASLDKAKIGSQTGEAEVFLPSQLVSAARQSERKYGPSTLKDLGKAGQEVLPSTVPNSGTADRALMAGVGLAGLGGAGATEYAIQQDADTTMKVGGVLAALAALNTRAGHRAFETIALDRPDAAKQFIQNYRARKGLFGKVPQGISGTTGAAIVLPAQ